MNRIIENIYKNRFNYCHVLEIDTLEDLKTSIDAIFEDLDSQPIYGVTYSKDEIFEFINTLEIYCLDEDEEDSVYNFDINKYLIQNYGQ